MASGLHSARQVGVTFRRLLNNSPVFCCNCNTEILNYSRGIKCIQRISTSSRDNAVIQAFCCHLHMTLSVLQPKASASAVLSPMLPHSPCLFWEMRCSGSSIFHNVVKVWGQYIDFFKFCNSNVLTEISCGQCILQHNHTSIYLTNHAWQAHLFRNCYMHASVRIVPDFL